MKKVTILLLVILFSSFGFAHDENVKHYVDMTDASNLSNPNGNYEYMIVKGDYLSMLADKFYDNPLKWTKIYKANPYIVDPNWIYPNNWLVIPSVYKDGNGNWIYSVDKLSEPVQIDLDGDGIVDGVDLDGDGVIDADAGIDLNGDGIIDGYDLDGDGIIDVKSNAAVTAEYGIDVDGDGIIDGVDLDGDGVIDADAGIDLDGDGVIDGYDVDGDGIVDILAGATAAAAVTQIDLDGDGIIDGVDLDGDGVIDADAGIDLNGDGIIDGYDLDGDGIIDVKSNAAVTAEYGIDVDGDGIIDGVDLDGDGVIDADAGIDLDGDGVIDGYDVDGDGIVDILAGATAAAAVTTAAMATDDKDNQECDGSSMKSYCGKPGWSLGLHAGYPLGSAPEDETLNLGLLLGTPIGVKLGPVSVGLGAGAFTYDFDKVYFGGGLLASLCLNEIFKLDMPIILQLHGTGFYIFGEGPAFGAIGSGTIPLGKSPLSLGLYGALGKYYPNDDDYNWSNVGALLQYSF